MLLVHLRQQRGHQLRQVLLVIAQRRHGNVEDVQPVVQVVAQMSLRHRLFRNLVGGRQHAHVHRGFHLAAQAPQLAVFQHAQQLGLGADGHFADFVQQQRAALGQFEAADAALQRAGECALLVAEDFAFDQRFRNGGAVDGDERLALARAELVDGARHQLLAGAAFAGDQHRGGAGRHHLDQVEDLLHFARRAHHRAQDALVAQRAPRDFQFALGIALADGVFAGWCAAASDRRPSGCSRRRRSSSPPPRCPRCRARSSRSPCTPAAGSATRRSSSMPSMRGIIRSVTTMVGDQDSIFSSASTPSRAVSHLKPHSVASSARPVRSFSSSSTMSTFSWFINDVLLHYSGWQLFRQPRRHRADRLARSAGNRFGLWGPESRVPPG